VTSFGLIVHIDPAAAMCIVTIAVLAFVALRFNPLALICWTRALHGR
jgi:hypothetical protein